MKGYKVFTPDWTCRGFQYEVGKIYETDKPLVICENGFHFCKQAKDCFDYYRFDSENKVAEVVARGEIVTEENKSCTNQIEVVREIPWIELLTIVNTGKDNSGLSNTGHRNTGDCNTGHRNTGDCNTGHRNTGHRNTGDCNTGNRNTGDCNTGNRNTGYYNTGHRNTGDCNTGDCNTGNLNTGHRNTGYYNTGYYNTGDRNTGHRNTGYYNTGDFNLSNNNAGCFCTETHKILLFDKESDFTLEQWHETKAFQLLSAISFRIVEWIDFDEMTDSEKAAHPEHATTGGFLRKNDTSKCYSDWWDELTKSQRNIIKAIPNFDAEKFYKITGIKVEE